MSLIFFFYLFIILIYLAIGAAIIFHMLYYRINRHVATIMFFIYVIGGILLLTLNYSFYRAVNWYGVFSGTGF